MSAVDATSLLSPGFFCSPTRILFGPGCRRDLPPLLKKLGFARVAVITDAWFESQSSFVRELVEGCAAQGIACSVFAGGEPDPTLALCDAATAAVRKQLDRPTDAVIALGGGSNTDLAKVLCLTLPGAQPAETYVGVTTFPVKPLPLIAMPTTAGTASEITPGAILIRDEHSPKVAVMGNDLRALVAVVDPELTLTCPPRVTADAGVDALTHAIESYVTQDASGFDRGGDADPGYSGRNPVTRIFARESISLCFRYLERAYRDGADLEARAGMCMASLYAGLSYASAGLNAVHALAYGLGAVKHETHGRSNGVLLPYVMDSITDTRAADLGEIAALAKAEGLTAGQPAARIVRDLIVRVGMPENLKDFGIQEGDIARVVEGGLAVARLTKAYPAPDAPARYRRLVENAYFGRLGS